MSQEPAVPLDFGRFTYELALLEPPDFGQISRRGMWVFLSDGCSEGDALSLGLAGGEDRGIEVELRMTAKGPRLTVYDWRSAPAMAAPGSAHDPERSRQRDAISELPAIDIDLETLVITTNDDEARKAFSQESH